MPEIWLNYGRADVVLDIRAENLDQNIDADSKTLEENEIIERLGSLETSKPIELVVLHHSKAVQKVISTLFSVCEQKSLPFPKILSDKNIMNLIKSGLPEGSAVSEFESSELSNSNLVFIGEMEFDGLFGYETIATRLVKRFGQENMLSAYAKRKGNLPTPGQITESMVEAKKFVDNFEIHGIEVVANSKGIAEIGIGHPSSTLSCSKTFESFAVKDVGQHKTLIISTGKDASNDTLGKSLSSLWNCSGAVKKDGLAILVAECKFGLGSEAIQEFLEGRLNIDRLRNPSKYIDGMEDLLFLNEIQKNFQIGLVSILPEFYSKKLNMISMNGIKHAMDYILKTQGPRQKVAVVSDGARVLLR